MKQHSDGLQCKYKRVVLKLSGEAFAGPRGFGLDLNVVDSIARQIRDVAAMGVQMSIVVGGGNFWRGAKGEREGMDRATSDYIGMLATVINGMALQERLEKLGLETRLMTAIDMREVAEPYIRRKAIHHLNNGRIVILGQVLATPTSQLIQLQHLGPQKSALKPFSWVSRALMVSTIQIRTRIQTRKNTNSWITLKLYTSGSGSWMPQLRPYAWITVSLLLCLTWMYMVT